MAILRFDDCATNRAPGRLLRRIDRLMSAFVESRFESLEISFMQWIELKVIRDGVATTAGELARELAITHIETQMGVPRKTLLKDAEEAADLVLLHRRGNAERAG